MKLLKKFAYAKINLGLEVLYKRDDGFHEINTVFLPIKLHDVLEFSTSEQIEVITIPDIFIPENENIVYKAAQFLKQKCNPQTGVKITMVKNIPTGAGLGGGSSDAAAALTALNEFWNLGLNYEELKEAALQLGSDVPYFLKHGAAIGKGRGEILEYFDLNLPFHIVTINTGLIIPTAWAYNSLKRTTVQRKPKDFKQILENQKNNFQSWKDKIINDFEESVMPLYADLREIKDELYKSGAVLALLSGSGSSMFGLFSDEDQTMKIQDKFPNYLVHITHPNS